MNRNLYFPNDENGDVLRHMAESGDNLFIPRAIDFSVVLANEENARTFAAIFIDQCFIVRVNRTCSAPELPWDVVVVKIMILSHSEITRFEEELSQAAEPLGGRNDGWGCFEQRV